MRKIRVCAWLAAIGTMAVAGDAFAVTIDCTMTPGALATAFAGGGTAGTSYQITGPCTGNFAITQDNITIEPNGMVNNTINGEVTISNAQNLVLASLTIMGPASITPPTVRILGPAGVSISNSFIQNDGTHGAQGIVCKGPANVDIFTSTIQNIGPGNFAGFGTDGPAAGLLATGSCFVTIESSAILNNGGDGLNVSSGATVAFRTGSITVPSTASTRSAVVAAGQSHVALDTVTVHGPSFGTNDTILAFQGAGLFVHHSTITSDSVTAPTIGASVSSSVVLAGGNTIEDTSVGLALEIDHSSSLFENDGTRFGFTGAADAITGDGLVQVESSMQLGTGGATPSLWTGDIKVQQNSAFTMGGGMTITGFVRLGQQSNGFFNQANGGTNTVSGTVSCPATMGNPASHVANPTLVTPNVAVGGTFATTTPPACLRF